VPTGCASRSLRRRAGAARREPGVGARAAAGGWPIPTRPAGRRWLAVLRVARGAAAGATGLEDSRRRAHSKTPAIFASRSSRMKPGLARSFPAATRASHSAFATSAAVQDGSAILRLGGWGCVRRGYEAATQWEQRRRTTLGRPTARVLQDNWIINRPCGLIDRLVV
jgi:hypothetical protein